MTGQMLERLRTFRMATLTGLLLLSALTAVEAAVTIRVEPEVDTPRKESCLAFGAGPGAGFRNFDDGAPGFDGTSPFMGLIYRNVPPFELQPGDELAFDLGKKNDFDVQLDIAMAATTENGSEFEAGPFTTVVTNMELPDNPTGDDDTGNFEMSFTVENAFSFAGGGLVIRFSNGSESYREDETCTESQVGVVADSSDPSGFFVNSFYRDTDGIAPFGPFGDGAQDFRRTIINGFQIEEPDENDLIMISNDYIEPVLDNDDAHAGGILTVTGRLAGPDDPLSGDGTQPAGQ